MRCQAQGRQWSFHASYHRNRPRWCGVRRVAFGRSWRKVRVSFADVEPVRASCVRSDPLTEAEVDEPAVLGGWHACLPGFSREFPVSRGFDCAWQPNVSAYLSVQPAWLVGLAFAQGVFCWRLKSYRVAASDCRCVLKLGFPRISTAHPDCHGWLSKRQVPLTTRCNIPRGSFAVRCPLVM